MPKSSWLRSGPARISPGPARMNSTTATTSSCQRLESSPTRRVLTSVTASRPYAAPAATRCAEGVSSFLRSVGSPTCRSHLHARTGRSACVEGHPDRDTASRWRREARSGRREPRFPPGCRRGEARRSSASLRRAARDGTRDRPGCRRMRTPGFPTMGARRSLLPPRSGPRVARRGIVDQERHRGERDDEQHHERSGRWDRGSARKSAERRTRRRWRPG